VASAYGTHARMTRDDLIKKLLRIEALHSGATTPGERDAAASARERILDRLRRTAAEDPPVEMHITLHDPWTQLLFVALCRRYELRPFRRPRQHRQTIMLRVPRRFLHQTLWPEFQELSRELTRYLSDVTQRVIREAIHDDASDAPEINEPAALE
jgi:hypothetical protein